MRASFACRRGLCGVLACSRADCPIMADSSTRERSKRTASAGAQPPQQSQSSNNSNLDSFFKRLGQGQSSRLWAGPRQRSGAAVPGSLRTRIHARTDDSTGGSGNGIINSNVAADLLRAREGKHGATGETIKNAMVLRSVLNSVRSQGMGCSIISISYKIRSRQYFRCFHR